MVFVPLATLVVGPVMAVGLVFVIDAPFALPLAARAIPKARWRELVPLLVGSTLFLPVGALLLTRLDPTIVRWTVACLILAGVTGLASGWRYAAPPSVPRSFGTGGLSGLVNGLAGLGGMPLALFWLAGQHNDAAQIRNNLLTYFAVNIVVSLAVMAWSGVVDGAVLRGSVLLLAPYGLGILIGSRGFLLASDRVFRRVAYGIIAGAAVLALPVLDAWLR